LLTQSNGASSNLARSIVLYRPRHTQGAQRKENQQREQSDGSNEDRRQDFEQRDAGLALPLHHSALAYLTGYHDCTLSDGGTDILARARTVCKS
jgi:hypothetical protein